MNKRQLTILGWALLALGRGALYLPIRPDYGDLPIPLTKLFDTNHVWIPGVIWVTVATLGLTVAVWPQVPDPIERAWWGGILAGVLGWGLMYTSVIFLHGIDGDDKYKLFWAGELYLAIGLVVWATKGDGPLRVARRLRTFFTHRGD